VRVAILDRFQIVLRERTLESHGLITVHANSAALCPTDLGRVARCWATPHRGMNNRTDTTTEDRVKQAVVLGSAAGASTLRHIELPIALALRVLLHPV